MDLPDSTQATSWEGMEVVDRDGQPLGRCVGVFADTETGLTEWLDVDVTGHTRSFVPAIDATAADGTVRVRFTRDAVVSAPSVGDQQQLSKADEHTLYRHYDVPVSSDADSVLPAGVDASSGTTTTDTTTPTSTSTTATSTVAAGAGVAAAGAGAAGITAASAGGAGDAGAPLADGSVASDLPVLDPAAASTTVPESQVTYVDQPEDFAREEPAAAQPPASAPPQEAPKLRRVTSEPGPSTSSPSPAPSPAPSPPPMQTYPPAKSGGAAAPLAAIAALAGAVLFGLRLRDKRARRRAAPGRRLTKALTGSSALRTAGRTLSGVPSSASSTGRQVSAGAGRSAQRAAQQAAQLERLLIVAAADKANRGTKKVGSSLGSASSAVGRGGQTASASLNAAATAASKELSRRQRRAAGQRRRRAAGQALRSVTSVPGSLASSVGSTGSSLSRSARRSARKTAKKTARSTGRSRSGALSSAPRTVSVKARKARRSLGRKLWDLVLLSAAGGGYVLGARAGRERYEEITDATSAVASSPQVQSLTETVKDPQKRSQLVSTVRAQVAALTGRG